MSELKLSRSARERIAMEGGMYGPSPEEYVPQMAAEYLTRPSNSAWRDDELWVTHTQMFAYSPLADDLLGESNYHCILAALTAEFPGDDRVQDSSFGHWTYAHFSAIRIRVLNKRGRITPEFALAAVIARGLADEYPVYDEDDYSQREWRAFEDAFHSEFEWLTRGVEVSEGDAHRIWEYVNENHYGESDPGYVDRDWITEAAAELNIDIAEEN